MAEECRAKGRVEPVRHHRPGAIPRQFAAIGAGDADFREYVNSRGRALLRSAYLLTGNLADAEDLVQSALAKTYQAWDRIEDRAAIDGYVRRAIVNTHISWWRRRKVDEYPTDEIPDQPVADSSGDSELRDMLKRAVDRLPQRMRAAVVLRFFEDMTEAEVAEVLGVSQGTVKSTVSRAVAKLRADRDLLAESTAIHAPPHSSDDDSVPRLPVTFRAQRGNIHPSLRFNPSTAAQGEVKT
jgi:RNA polymerase sigma-70 factor (sigma-E family)